MDMILGNLKPQNMFPYLKQHMLFGPHWNCLIEAIQMICTYNIRLFNK